VISVDSRIGAGSGVDNRTCAVVPRRSVDLGGDGEISMTTIPSRAGARPLSLWLWPRPRPPKRRGGAPAISRPRRRVAPNRTARIGGNLPFGAQPSPARSRIHGSVGRRDAGAFPRVWSGNVIRVFGDVASRAPAVVGCACAAFPVRSAGARRLNRLGPASDQNVSLALIIWRNVCLSNIWGACLF
jgi:hypothetical protein